MPRALLERERGFELRVEPARNPLQESPRHLVILDFT